LGNHDASNAQGAGGFRFQRERDAAAKYWKNPAHHPGLKFGDRADYPFSYTFTISRDPGSEKGDVFFLVWDASGSKILPETLQWAETALASEAAQSARLRIVLGHLPLYSIAQGRAKPGEVLDNADQLRSLLEKYNVHTYISGHHHAYYPAHRCNLQLLHAGLLGSGRDGSRFVAVPAAGGAGVVLDRAGSGALGLVAIGDLPTLFKNCLPKNQSPPPISPTVTIRATRSAAMSFFP